MSVMLLTENNLEFLSLKGCCKGSSESTLVKMPRCWRLDVAAHMKIFIVGKILCADRNCRKGVQTG